ncbi:MAG TPA: hypothetical protein VGP83_13250 [Pyrinomonadaceae bacterium]|nr:hypothetical protein [Pyrinomonadaceae bacterium]
MKIWYRLSMCFAMLAIVAGTSLSVSAQSYAGADGTNRSTNVARKTFGTTLPITTASTITTLYANDPIAHSLCLADGREGGVFQNGEPRNRCSHIEFDAYKTGSLSVGIEGGEIGRIIDLGTDDELSKQYGYQLTVGKGQGFASIEFRDGKLVIMKDRLAGTRQALVQGQQLFETGQTVASAEARAGHIYLARITDTHNADFQILVKLLVLSSRPGDSVTFRWELL